MLIHKKQGLLLRLQKIEREITSIWHAHFSYDTPENLKNQTAFGLQKWLFNFKTGFSDTKTAFRLQIFNCRLQRWLLALQLT